MSEKKESSAEKKLTVVDSNLVWPVLSAICYSGLQLDPQQYIVLGYLHLFEIKALKSKLNQEGIGIGFILWN